MTRSTKPVVIDAGHGRMRRLVLPALVAASALLCAPHARADADAFVTHLTGEGITDVNGPAGLISLGEIACSDVESGYSYAHEAKKFLEFSAAGAQEGRQTPTLTPHQALSIVGYATQDLCPDAANVPVTRG